MLEEYIDGSYKNDEGIVLNGKGDPLSRLDRESLVSLVEKHGFVVFRNFHNNMEEFTKLVEKTSIKQSLDPARVFYSNIAQKVDAGYGSVGLHCENGNSPFWPDIAWFFCEKAAKTGSQTTVCDGQKVWSSLKSETRELFLKKNIIYSRNVSEKLWKDYVFHCNGGNIPAESIELQHLKDLTSGVEKVQLDLLPDGSVFYSCEVPAAKKTRFSNELSFANSILGPSYNYEKPSITFADASEIPEEVMNELLIVTEDYTLEVDWQDGDAVMIDNTRYMHGRRAIEDKERTLYNSLSYV